MSANLWGIKKNRSVSKKIPRGDPAKKKELLCFVPKASYFFMDVPPNINSSRQRAHAAMKTACIWLFQLKMRSWASQNLSRNIGGFADVKRNANLMAKKQCRDMYGLNVNNGVSFDSSSKSSPTIMVVLVTGLQKYLGGFMLHDIKSHIPIY